MSIHLHLHFHGFAVGLFADIPCLALISEIDVFLLTYGYSLRILLGIGAAANGDKIAGVVIHLNLHLGDIAAGSFTDIPILALFCEKEILMFAQGYFFESFGVFDYGIVALKRFGF